MYKAGQADAKTGPASVENSQGADNGVRPSEAANRVQVEETVETNSSTEQQGAVKTEQLRTTTTQQSGSELNTELEAKLAPFESKSQISRKSYK